MTLIAVGLPLDRGAAVSSPGVAPQHHARVSACPWI